jgi:peptide/nickel transport system substrate-binding protein
MDWKRLDRARSSVSPLELDLVEHYASGKINRRDFLRRGAILGVSVPVMGMVIAACGGDDGEASTEGTGGTATPTVGGSIVVGIQTPSSPLDPVNMLDLGTYAVLSQSFEYLVGVESDGATIGATGLATGWSPNEAGDVWTFQLRQGVKWQDGSNFTSADVAATMDRMAEANNAGLGSVIAVGSTDASDPAVAVISLVSPNGNFPVLVSTFNAQSLITPTNYETGTTLDGLPAGTGAWILDSYTEGQSARFSRNPDWWGGTTPLDNIELQQFEATDTMVTALQDGSIDAIQQFSVIGGEGLLDNPDFVVRETEAATHRQVWFNTQNGQFSNSALRRAMALTFDRNEMVELLFSGRARVGNDHPIIKNLPFYDPDAVPQRERDIDAARAALAEGGMPDGFSSVINHGDIQEIPDLAAIIQRNAVDAGFDLSVNQHPNSTFYGDSWCPESAEGEAPCFNASEMGIVDWGHRPTPDVFLTSALETNGVWNASVYANADFDALVKEYQAAVNVEGQTAAISQIQKHLWENVPASYPYFFNFLSASRREVDGLVPTALGHVILSGTSVTE